MLVGKKKQQSNVENDIVPTNLEYHQGIKIKLNGQQECQLIVVDSGGDPLASAMRMNLCESIRPDGYMIFFAIDDRTSFNNIELWQGEIQTINEDAPILLVANKSDLRH